MSKLTFLFSSLGDGCGLCIFLFSESRITYIYVLQAWMYVRKAHVPETLSIFAQVLRDKRYSALFYTLCMRWRRKPLLLRYILFLLLYYLLSLSLYFSCLSLSLPSLLPQHTRTVSRNTLSPELEIHLCHKFSRLAQIKDTEAVHVVTGIYTYLLYLYDWRMIFYHSFCNL